jgi:hypothetical protein
MEINLEMERKKEKGNDSAGRCNMNCRLQSVDRQNRLITVVQPFSRAGTVSTTTAIKSMRSFFAVMNEKVFLLQSRSPRRVMMGIVIVQTASSGMMPDSGYSLQWVGFMRPHVHTVIIWKADTRLSETAPYLTVHLRYADKAEREEFPEADE